MSRRTYRNTHAVRNGKGAQFERNLHPSAKMGSFSMLDGFNYLTKIVVPSALPMYRGPANPCLSNRFVMSVPAGIVTL